MTAFTLRECAHRLDDEAAIIEVLNHAGEVCGTITGTDAGVRVRGFGFFLVIETPDGADGPRQVVASREPEVL